MKSEDAPQFNPDQQPKSPELDNVLKLFGIKDVNLKEATQLLLQQAYELFNSASLELSQVRSLEINGEQFFLQYNIYPRESGQVWIRVGLFKNQPPALIKNATAFNEGEVAMTRLMFNFEKGRVSGEVGTDENFEGRGFGSALVFMEEGIIRDIIRRYRDKVTPDGFKNEIVDNSRSSNEGKNYEGWTSSMAQKMGFEKIDENKFVKSYKPDDLK
ncbi:MAG: hypothetical protein A3I32_02935 [Candidatus Yanofskybacteria bacterium RIFCSPLOWO2_02_FULL_45_10]|uniref:Uncharacterized protein n=1 Tax=Candidatus Yanofskybacteria bacterium RIFCSPLOWO2_02_FULL_45_10 TaxID=1802706 RepID=A0A1F8H433_9BACT|nr:MAG: hypothetical protein A3I32_02935 [Candidatus Yanofskybacteria bacterium RIFCSPLOWO2_02_FULL_45_10]